MALLPQEPKQQRALLLLIVAIAAAGLFWNYWETPEREEIATATERVESLEAQNQAARIAAARGEEGLEENLATFERHIARLEELVPRAQDVPGLITDLNLQAERLDLEGLGFFSNPEQPGVAYNLQTFDMTWLGEYHDVARFLAEIASFERILTPVQLQLAVPANPALFPDYEAPVQADFTIMTYVLPPPGQALPMDSTTVEGG
jgi:type IV pilus assembly protein PilO